MIKIRTLQKSDGKQLHNLLVDFYKKNQRGEIVSKNLLSLIKYKDYDEVLRKETKRYIRLNTKKAVIFVAEDNRKLIGYIHGQIRNKPGRVLDRVGYIEDWFVKKKYRGKGVGEMLWNELINWFKKRKCNCLETDAYTTNKFAIKVYHKLGFVDKTISMINKL
jgi:ribosomal protein S18 acetylase RimI-like enzyme